MLPPSRFRSELKNRPTWQVGGLYLGFSWIVLQVIDVLAQNLDLPSSLFPLALALLATGLPIVLITSVVQRVSSTGEGTRFGRLNRVFTWRNAMAGGLIAFAAWGVYSAGSIILGLGGSVGSGSTEGTLPERTLAVLPFTFRGNPELAYLGDGLVELLSTKMDGAGDLRAVDPRAILSLTAAGGGPRLSPSQASDFSDGIGAGLFVLGSIIEVGDRLTISATLYEQGPSPQPLTEASETGEATAIFESIDGLAAQLLGGLADGPAARVQQVAAVSTGSLPALRAYLEGEQAYRLGLYREAVAAFQQAVALDSAYAVAYYRLSVVAEFSTLSTLAQESAELAFRNAARLSERDRGLLEAFLAWRRGAHAEAESLYRSMVRAYPDEVEAWFELGEVLIHGNPLHGRSFAEAWEPFQRALELDPANTAAMYHLARIASVTGRFTELDSLTESHNRLNPGGDRELEVRALHAFSRPQPSAQTELLELLRTGSDVGVALAGWDAATWTEDVDGARQVVTVLADRSRPTEVRTLAHAWLAQLELAAGRPSQARHHLEEMRVLDAVAALEYRALLSANPLMQPTPSELVELAAELEALDAESVPPSRNPSIFYSVHDRIHPLLRTYLLGVVHAQLGASQTAQQYAQATAATPTGPAEGSLPRDLGASVRAQILAQAGEPAEALGVLEGIARELWYIGTLSSPFYGQVYERFLRGELLFEVGRLEEAVPWFSTLSQIAPYELAYRALAYERLGQIHEALGNPVEAMEYHRKFVTLWRDADPALRPRVEEAQSRIGALGG